MTVRHKIPEFLKQVEELTFTQQELERNSDYSAGPRNTIAIVRIIPHATEILPWVHITKEWEIIVNKNIMLLSGVLAPRIQVFIALNGENTLQVMLQVLDEMDYSKRVLFDKTVLSTEEADIIGCISQMLGVYIHEVSTGVRQFFRQYSVMRHHGLGVDNMLLSREFDEDLEYHFRPSNDIILSPTELTFYDLETQQWVHPKNRNIEYVKKHNIVSLNENNLGWAQLPEFKRRYPLDKEKNHGL